MTDDSERHSADFFGPLRDHWWNRDYLELLARRLQLSAPVRALDVGCGQGHWGQALAHVLAAGSAIVGIDREPAWLTMAQARSQTLHLPVTFDYRVGDVLSLAFPDDSFDLVTCQTVLIHIDQPLDGLAEMLRVVKPGGWLLCAEPNNLAGSLIFDSTAWAHQLDSLLGGVELQLQCELGKSRLGEGFNSAGELLPGWLASMNVDSLQVYLSDKALPIWPPYPELTMTNVVAEARKNLEEERLVWTKEKTRQYWLAGGGDEERFEQLWSSAMSDLRCAVEDMARNTWFAAGGALMYIVAAKKREQ